MSLFSFFFSVSGVFNASSVFVLKVATLGSLVVSHAVSAEPLAASKMAEPATWIAPERLQQVEHTVPIAPDIAEILDILPHTPIAPTVLVPESGRYSPLESGRLDNSEFYLLNYKIPPNTATRLTWVPSQFFNGLDVKTPVMVVNGATQGDTLCLTAAVHGDELNGIEIVRQIMFGLDPARLRGRVVGVPIVNMMSFGRNSRYLPDRRDLNRFFPGSVTGSLASRFAHDFFHNIIKNCDALVDIHTGSFHRTNLLQVRADLSQPEVYDLAHSFGRVVVLNGLGHVQSLRRATVTAGIPAVTIEAGEPLRIQKEMVQEGVDAIITLLKKRDMIDSSIFWREPAPAFYSSAWIRVESSGILFSEVELGDRIAKGDRLGTVTNPITSETKSVIALHNGKVIGMALDQFVLPGFAAYHVGIINDESSPIPASPEEDGPEEDGFED